MAIVRLLLEMFKPDELKSETNVASPTKEVPNAKAVLQELAPVPGEEQEIEADTTEVTIRGVAPLVLVLTFATFLHVSLAGFI